MDPYGSADGGYDLQEDLGVSEGSVGGRREGSLPLSCKECRASKVKCERVFPCARCVRLGLSCSPQVRKKRRQPIKPAAAPAPTFPINTENGVRYLKHTPISALVKAFFELKEQGALIRPRALCFFRSWARVRELYGLKRLEMIHDMMCKGLGLDDWRDLLHNEEVIREMVAYTGADDGSGAQATPDEAVAKQSGAHAIDNLPFFIKELFYSTNCACKLTVVEDVLPVSFGNDLFDRLFNPGAGNPSESLFYFPPSSSKQDSGGMSLSECMIRAIHPTDGAELFTLIGHMFFGGQSNPCGISHIVRCRTARGESFMAMVRARFHINAGGRSWSNIVAFQPLPMSRFLFPLAKPHGPNESSQESTFASLSVFEEPAQPQSCKTCEVLTKEALSFHFRSLTEGPKDGEESCEDMFVSQGSLDRMKAEESGEEDPSKKARSSSEPSGFDMQQQQLQQQQQYQKPQAMAMPAPISYPHQPPPQQVPPKASNMAMPFPPPIPPKVPSFNQQSKVPSFNQQSKAPSFNQQSKVPSFNQNHKAAAGMPVSSAPMWGEYDTLPMAPPLRTTPSEPSFHLSPSEVEALDAFLAEAEDEEEDMPQASWENWEESKEVGEDFWQTISGFGSITPDQLDGGLASGVPAQGWGMVTE